MRARVAALLLGLPLPAQAEVAVRHELPAAALQAARRLVRERLPELRVRWIPARARELLARREQLGDLLVGVGGVTLAALAADGRLRPHASAACRGLEARFRFADFAVPLLAPIVLAFAAPWDAESAPRDHDDLLFDPRYDGEIVLCEPWAMPALWVGWIQHHRRRGRSEEWTFAWLRTLDARVRSYRTSARGVLGALRRGEGSLGYAFLSDLAAAGAAGGGGPGWVLPRSGVPLRGLGIALPASGERAGSARLFDLLASAEAAVALARAARLVPAPRADLPAGALSRRARRALAAAMPYDPESAEAERWFARWRDEVRGRGRRQVALENVLEAVFAVAFLVFLVFVYRHLSRSEHGRAA